MLNGQEAYELKLRERNQREVDNLATTIWRKGLEFVASFVCIADEYCSSEVAPHGTEEPALFFNETVLLTLTGPKSNPNPKETVTNSLVELSSILTRGIEDAST